MLLVKCGRKEYELELSDEIMYNGACYQITTKKKFNEPNPILAKRKAEELIKNGDLVLSRVEDFCGMKMEIYKPRND